MSKSLRDQIKDEIREEQLRTDGNGEFTFKGLHNILEKAGYKSKMDMVNKVMGQSKSKEEGLSR